ncbi:hypothetical protein [Pseudanabaena sp. ABRG5-3]|uniref:hypothetical protein n=1 Tax=Pseudanabaena sp. ABRG5-3 TaxID=685565 RepID=UPI000DC6FBC8|nr:hypothetical protein [Pseudanabaena sp. ABRG5-3]BBC23772.1 hypothetical protein ABRG53_1515 [Pseudanabaena sp. ABRG5-3]
MQATVIDAQIEQELEPQIRLWSIADYHQMIEAGILDEDDRVELLEEKIVLQAFSDVAISLDAMFPIAENLQS